MIQPRKEGRLRKRKRYERPDTHLCLICDKKAVRIMCETCRDQILAQFGNRTAMIYCKGCRQCFTPDRRKHGLEVAGIRPKQDKERVLIVYEQDSGCPDCQKEDATTAPHPVFNRIAG